MFYGWAEKNTRPQVPSNEKGRRNKLNGMIAVDAVTGEEYLKLTEKSKTEDVSNYFALLASDCVQQGVKKLSVILDNNSTHKQKMKSQLQLHLMNLNIQDKITVEFLHTPAYSPDFNLAEYIIHLVRLQLLHHLPLGLNIQQVREKLETYFHHFHLQTPQQIKNIIQHICSKVETA
jgi:hypothetical protein